jgi:hydroxyacylglutathione hydrolase
VLPDRDGAADEAVDQLIRIGFDRLVGVLAGGVDAWATAGEPLAGMATVTPSELADELRTNDSPVVVDVRDPKEWREEGRIEDAVEMPLSSIIAGLDPSIPDRAPVTVACKSGSRATIAAGLLEARGHPVRLVARGGIPDVAERLATESERA